MKLKKQKHPFAYALCYGALLAGFTGYVMLDTFVLPKAEDTSAGEANYSIFEGIEQKSLDTSSDTSSESSSQASKQEQLDTRGSTKTSDPARSAGRHSRSTVTDTDSSREEASSSEQQSTAPASGEEGYSDENISVTMQEYNQNGTVIYVADVRLSSAQYLKTAFAKDTYGKNVTAKTSATAQANGAILAVNGDYYGARESGIVIRNSVLYRDTAAKDTEIMCIYADGHIEIINGTDKSAQQLIDEGVWQAFSFGPGLVIDGEIAVNEGEEVGRAKASNPRTAIGIIDDLHYIFVVSDGRTDESEGLSLSELAQFMKSLGAQQAYNLDGGGSSTMYYDGQVINNPTTSGSSIKERSVSDIVYIGY